MVTKNELLKILPLYNDNYLLYVKEQTTSDIIIYMYDYARKMQFFYDRICLLFYNNKLTIYNNCYNLWYWVKKNIKYKIESDDAQILQTPQSMLQSGNTVDCKGYSLFIYGILKGWKKYNLINDVEFSFASYDNTPQPSHVYVTCENFIIDACMNNFNSEKSYTFKDNFKSMISGINFNKPYYLGSYDPITNDPTPDDPAPDDPGPDDPAPDDPAPDDPTTDDPTTDDPTTDDPTTDDPSPNPKPTKPTTPTTPTTNPKPTKPNTPTTNPNTPTTQAPAQTTPITPTTLLVGGSAIFILLKLLKIIK